MHERHALITSMARICYECGQVTFIDRYNKSQLFNSRELLVCRVACHVSIFSFFASYLPIAIAHDHVLCTTEISAYALTHVAWLTASHLIPEYAKHGQSKQ